MKGLLDLSRMSERWRPRLVRMGWPRASRRADRVRCADALEQLESLRRRLDGTDLAEALRETGRCLRCLGRRGEATAAFGDAIRRFEEAGERWETQATRRELGALE